MPLSVRRYCASAGLFLAAALVSLFFLSPSPLELPPPPPTSARHWPSSSPSSPSSSYRDFIRQSTWQCDRVYADAMPENTRYGPSSIAEDAAACPNPSAASENAVRGPAPREEWAGSVVAKLRHARYLGDGLPDGALTLPQCAPKWYTPHEACALLTRAGPVVFIGDSLARHLLVGLKLVLSGNYALGGFIGPQAGNPTIAERCACDGAFGPLHTCHTIQDPSGPSAAALCPQWGGMAASAGGVSYLPWWADYWQEGGVESRVNGTAWGGGVIVDELGPAFDHDWLPDSPHVKAHLDAVQAAATATGSHRICYLATAPTPAKKMDYLPRQGDAATRAVNARVREHCLAGGGRILDGYALTRGVWSYDGTHYSSQINVANAQMLLNVISSAVQERERGKGG